MEVRRLQLLEGARAATGLAVVFDVLRASSNVVTLLSRGAAQIIPVATVEAARQLKKADPRRLLAGERDGLAPAGFDLGNSPVEALSVDLTARTMILTTSAGTKGMVAAAAAADEVLVGCFLNAAAVARRVHATQPDILSLVALGTRGEVPAPEDDLAADYLEGLLAGRPPALGRIFRSIREHPEGRKFSDPENTSYRADDLAFCLRADIFDVVPVLRDGCIVLG